MSCKKWYMGTNTKMYKTIAQTNQFIGRLSELTADIDRSGWELFGKGLLAQAEREVTSSKPAARQASVFFIK